MRISGIRCLRQKGQTDVKHEINILKHKIKSMFVGVRIIVGVHTQLAQHLLVREPRPLTRAA